MLVPTKNIKLLFYTVFVSLLAAVFVVVQMCLLNPSCHSELSLVVGSYRRVLLVHGLGNVVANRGGIKGSSEIEIAWMGKDDQLYQPGFRGLRANGSKMDHFIRLHDSISTIESTTTASGDRVKFNTHFESRTSSTPARNAATPLNTTPHIDPIETQLHEAVEAVIAENRQTPTFQIHSVTSSSPTRAAYLTIPKKASFMFQFHGSNRRCQLPHCTEYLTPLDQACVDYCVKKRARRTRSGRGMDMHGECRFMDGRGRAAVGLVSLPGSGNTWIRGLLEKATGICTGSVYCDVALKRAGFNGEGLRTGTVLVVKTHKKQINWTSIDQPHNDKMGTPNYGAVILLIRNPYNALVAEWNREAARDARARTDPSLPGPTTPQLHPHNSTTPLVSSSLHTRSVGPEYFGNNTKWKRFVYRKMRLWQKYFENIILKSPDRSMLVIQYEDFQRNKVKAVAGVLDFLYFSHQESVLEERLRSDFEMFHRQSHPSFEHYTKQQVVFMQRTLREVVDSLKTENSGVTYNIEDYLR